MSGHAETVLILSAFNFAQATQCLSSVFHYLKKQHDYSVQLEDDISSLLFNDEVNDFIATQIDTQHKNINEIQKEHPWLRLEGLVAIGEVVDYAETYLYPLDREYKKCSISISLGAAFYDAVYEEDEFDNEARRALIRFCLGVVNAAQSEGFVLVFDDEPQKPFSRINSVQLRHYLLESTTEELRQEPKLIIGIQNNLVLKEEIEAIWGKGENIVETTNGYIVFDIILPDEGDEEE
ncbi:MAG: hypothetical protein SVR94_06385 [Pseudomonadota bacterium]|nr:hypothetical protein [Pseudomonadota bacterium]